MKKIKQIRAFWKVYKNLEGNLNIMKVASDIFAFIVDAQEQKKHLCCRLINKISIDNDKPREDEIISLWAGIGLDVNPIERCRHLKAQTGVLKMLLKKTTETATLSDSEKHEIELVLKTFE